jgi:hypothetical protein
LKKEEEEVGKKFFEVANKNRKKVQNTRFKE